MKTHSSPSQQPQFNANRPAPSEPQDPLLEFGRTASGIVHDLNNALTPLIGFTDLLLRFPDLLANRSQLVRYLKSMRTGAQDAARIVGRLREIGNDQECAGAVEPVNLAETIEQVVALTEPKWREQAEARGAKIIVRTIVEKCAPVSADESDLREILTNLVFNAVDAMPEGGILSLRVRREDDFGVLEIGDTGTGMTEEVLRRCTEPFFSTKGDRGTGLGLPMVFNIVQQFGGSVEIATKLGEGTRFIIRLPLF